MSQNTIFELLFHKSIAVFEQNWLNVFPILNTDDITRDIQAFFFMKKNVNLFANKKFSGELPGLKRAGVISDGTNNHRKFYFNYFFGF